MNRVETERGAGSPGLFGDCTTLTLLSSAAPGGRPRQTADRPTGEKTVFAVGRSIARPAPLVWSLGAGRRGEEEERKKGNLTLRGEREREREGEREICAAVSAVTYTYLSIRPGPPEQPDLPLGGELFILLILSDNITVMCVQYSVF